MEPVDPLPDALVDPLAGPWRTTPVGIDPALRLEVERACRASMLPFPPLTQLVLVDARGQGRLQAIFAGPTGQQATCMDMEIDADGRVQAMGGGSTGEGDGKPVEIGPFELRSQGSMSSGAPGAVTSSLTSGMAGPGIASIVLEAPGQPQITASLANGWYAVWFPGAWPRATKVIGLDAFGTEVAQVFP